jgi:hypothetical protein
LERMESAFELISAKDGSMAGSRSMLYDMCYRVFCKAHQ